MASPRDGAREVKVRLDGKPLNTSQKTRDTRFRSTEVGEESYVAVQNARLYSLVESHDFGTHTLELICPTGVAVFAFTFNSCVDPSAAPTPATVESRS
jgi:hypothetical protein